ncbi:MAG: ankyrin repeat domain-containing protein, partial [Rickettsiales bacterium]
MYKSELNDMLDSAIRKSDVKAVKNALAKGASVNAFKIHNKFTPLHTAIIMPNYNIEIIKTLLDHGANIESGDIQGFVPIHHAVKKNIDEITKLIIASGANINAETSQGFTALHIATQNTETNSLKLLLDNNADIKATYHIGQTALHDASQIGNIGAVQVLLDYNASVNSQNDQGFTPLHSAAHGGYINVVELLIKHGADINIKNKYGLTALHVIAHNQIINEDHIKLARLLIDNKIDINAQDTEGAAAICKAAINNHIKLVKLLAENGADIKNLYLMIPNQNETYIERLEKQYPNIKRTLQDHQHTRQIANSDVDILTNKINILYDAPLETVNLENLDQKAGNLFMSILSGNIHSIRELIRSGLDVNTRFTPGGRTALHIASESGLYDVAQELINLGADVNSITDRGLSPLHAVAQKGDMDMAMILLTSGARHDIVTDNG